LKSSLIDNCLPTEKVLLNEDIVHKKSCSPSSVYNWLQNGHHSSPESSTLLDDSLISQQFGNNDKSAHKLSYGTRSTVYLNHSVSVPNDLCKCSKSGNCHCPVLFGKKTMPLSCSSSSISLAQFPSTNDLKTVQRSTKLSSKLTTGHCSILRSRRSTRSLPELPVLTTVDLGERSLSGNFFGSAKQSFPKRPHKKLAVAGESKKETAVAHRPRRVVTLKKVV
jgi:hypothetical protein